MTRYQVRRIYGQQRGTHGVYDTETHTWCHPGGHADMSQAAAAELADRYNTPAEERAAATPVYGGSLCRAEESGYLDSTDVFCPFLSGPDYTCTSGCPTNRERICVNGLEGE